MIVSIINGITSAIAGTDAQLQSLAGFWILIMLGVSISCFLISEITFNYSQVDKLWSILPVVYSFLTLSFFNSPRIIFMTLLVTTWGLRLTYNFYRKGGYNIIPWRGEEDYRWKVLRESPALKGRFRFGLFNLLFISFYQNLIILLFCSPLLIAARYNDANLNVLDLAAAMLMLTFIILESVSDNQLFRFHNLKNSSSRLPSGLYSGSLEKGFLSEGLWKYVRHPNFASEQAIWICFYIFSTASSGRVLNWTLAGPLLLVLLFQGSSQFTENISLRKYPEYSIYRKQVPKFIPRIF